MKLCSACDQCLKKPSYSEEFDAHFCPECNIWLEDRCKDPTCWFCPQRPERPLKLKSQSKINKTLDK